jgi:hypothetical protein
LDMAVNGTHLPCRLQQQAPACRARYIPESWSMDAGNQRSFRALMATLHRAAQDKLSFDGPNTPHILRTDARDGKRFVRASLRTLQGRPERRYTKGVVSPQKITEALSTREVGPWRTHTQRIAGPQREGQTIGRGGRTSTKERWTSMSREGKEEKEDGFLVTSRPEKKLWTSFREC